GMLSPYIREGRISECPSFTGLSYERPQTGYAYSRLIGGEYQWATGLFDPVPKKLSQIKRPSEALLFCDGAMNSEGEIYGSQILQNPKYTKTMTRCDFRHNDSVNIAYCDGHVSSEKNPYIDTDPQYSQLGSLSEDDSAYFKN
ncbi:MAG: hypothetical protein KBT47_08465, partial [Armatimonadetes bacterium]|nr:hypothetical protein [Candidatus Hippobium faecium]